MPNDWSGYHQVDSEPRSDLELLKSEVGQRFPFYDMKYNAHTMAFFCRIDEGALDENFDSLRLSLSEKGYIPMLRYVKGEHIIYVIRKSKKKEKPVWINISLLIAPIITTSLTGSILHMGYNDIWNIPRIMDIFMPENLFNGILLFAFPLMSILFIHEMGHYYVSKKHGIATSLPFFIPIPPVMPSFNIGTFGALISSRDPMPNRKALFDVGISGPLAGFIVAVPVTIIGIMYSHPVPLMEPSAGEIILGGSILFTYLSTYILNIPLGTPIDLSLIAFAGWVGLLITSINLLPAGQLDGGHIFRAFLGEKQKWAGWIAVMIMIFTGWFFFAIIIMFMMGMQHPPPLNDATPLDMRRKLLFFIAIIILVLCYIPYPIDIV
ncbi:MAG: site-2 protease family protein [Candidatus Thermoplasmatota archaeon]|nr:site-2 protease family protein [Candidatus Thermoplasmatota archaeon]